jgi:outer membrane protein assembly factor BamB
VSLRAVLCCRPGRVLLAVVAGVLAACSDSDKETVQSPAVSRAESSAPAPVPRADWPFYRGDRGLSGVAAGELPERPVLLWSFATAGAVTSSPVVAAGRVFFGSDDGKVYALGLEDGLERWSFATGDLVEAPPLVLDGRVFVGSSDGCLYALDADTGALRWKAETEDRIVGSASWIEAPDGDGARILVGSYDTRLYCFDAATGEQVWSYATDNYVNGTPAVLDGRVVFGGCDAALHVVSAVSGERLERILLGEECHIAGSVALSDGRVYFGHYGNAFVCIDLERSELIWEYTGGRQPFFSSPAIGADRVVFGGRDKRLHCVRRADGAPLWTFPTGRKVDGSPVICGDQVVFGSGDGRLYLLDLESGEELWSHDLGDSIFTSPAVVGDVFVVGCNDGSVYAFGPPSPAPDSETR